MGAYRCVDEKAAVRCGYLCNIVGVFDRGWASFSAGGNDVDEIGGDFCACLIEIDWLGARNRTFVDVCVVRLKLPSG